MMNYSEMLRSKWNGIKAAVSVEFRGVMVAHSGGPDSTALFALICECFKDEKNFRLGIFHVNYGLRNLESDADESFSRELATAHNVPFEVRRISQAERDSRKGESLQEWARRLRYVEFARLAAEGWVIALAHHQDDLAENALLRMARGAGPGHLAGMREWEEPIWRPLLSQKKADLLTFLTSKAQPYRVDSSNGNSDYSRNIIRQRVLPELESLFPGATERIAACAREAEDLAKWCDQRLEREIKDENTLRKVVKDSTQGIAFAAVAAWLKRFEPQIRLSREVLRLGVSRVSKGLSAWPNPHETRPTSAVRRLQHAGKVGSTAINAILEAGSHGIFNCDERLLGLGHLALAANGLTLNDQLPLDPKVFRLAAVSFSSVLRFRGSSRSWRLKKLLQAWRIPEDQRAYFKVLCENGEAIGLFDGQVLCRPNRQGEQEVIPRLNIDLRYW